MLRILRLALLLLLLLLLFPAPPRPDENERFCRPRRSANRLARKRFFVDLVDGIVGIVYWALDVPYTSARPEWVTWSSSSRCDGHGVKLDGRIEERSRGLARTWGHSRGRGYVRARDGYCLLLLDQSRSANRSGMSCFSRANIQKMIVALVQTQRPTCYWREVERRYQSPRPSRLSSR